MKLLIKEKLLTVLDDFNVYDEDGKKVYNVKGKIALTGKHCLVIEDKKGNRIGMVKEELISLLPCFEIYEGKKKIGHIQKKISLLKPKFHLDFNDWDIKGDYFEWDYKILKDKEVIGTIEKKLLHFKDTYIIDVKNPKDALYVLMIAIAIDNEKCTRDKKAEND